MLEKPQKGEWTCPGAHHLAIRLRVDREPRGDGVPIDSPKTVTSLLFGLGRLSSRTFWGAGWRQGQRNSARDPHRLDPDGWLVRSQTDTSINESPASQSGSSDDFHFALTGNGYGICGELLRTSPQLPQPRRRNEIKKLSPVYAEPPGPARGKRCPLDTRLLMGGTH